MYPVSDTFISTITRPHEMVSEAQVSGIPNGRLLKILGGNVSMDSAAETVRTLSLEVIDDDCWDMLLTPGAEIIVRRGIVGELVPLGVCILDADITLNEQEGIVTLSAADRSRAIARAKWIDPYQVAKGTNMFAAVADLITTALPQAADWLKLPTSGDVIDADITLEASESSNPWLDAQAIVRTYGYELVVDGSGFINAINVSLDRGVAWQFGGSTAPSLLSSSRRASFADVYNGVIVTGEGSEQAVNDAGIIRAVAWDEDPLSPTFYNGLFGRVPKFISSPLVTTIDQGIAMAQAELAKCKGIVEQLSWTQLVHPALEPYDQVADIREDKTSVLTIDKLTIPLDASGDMSAVAREVRS
jgi:hypothetical protein